MNNLSEKISDSELEVMRVLWTSGDALTITAICEALTNRHDWEDSTIRTLVRRLTQKGVLLQEKRGVYYYTSLVSEADYKEYRSKLLIDKLFGGSAKNLIAALVSNESFSDADIAELQNMFRVGKHDE